MLDQESKFEYDVAFSFLQKDEGIVQEINDLICDRYKTFIYSKIQEQLVGTDGEKTFNEVFGEKARIVVILYREEWGRTPWTRIEETAIRNRALENGYDFTTFIQLDSSAQMPKWLPKNRIFYNFGRWGAKGFAPIIDSKIQESGGIIKAITLEEQAKKIKRKLLLQAERNKFLCSTEAYEKAQDKFGELCRSISEKTFSLEDQEMNFHFHIENRDYNTIRIYSEGITLTCNWRYTYSNSLNDSGLTITLISINHLDPISRIRNRHSEDKILKRESYNFDINPYTTEIGWSVMNNNNTFYTNEILIDNWLQILILEVGKVKIDKQANR
jgi:hypothetical protein